eukprot:TRINITY_DN4046_c0_g1_i2.p2 TRINITY_DN4046_c0_g1~~TRINITY_DN4046_c0_g1_i2.p2  ORF type:complete len:209 (-),score=64.22 TRINITY_DN4046_c0_g1_i2:577-1203(-)
MDEDTVFKTAAAVFLFVVACAAGLVPLVARSGEKVHKHGPVSSALNCAAAGILLESGLCHLLPENAQLLQDAWGARLPYAHLVCGLGFLLILVADYSAAFCADTAASSTAAAASAAAPIHQGQQASLPPPHLCCGSALASCHSHGSAKAQGLARRQALPLLQHPYVLAQLCSAAAAGARPLPHACAPIGLRCLGSAGAAAGAPGLGAT